MAAAPAALRGRTHFMPAKELRNIELQGKIGLMCTHNHNLPANG